MSAILILLLLSSTIATSSSSSLISQTESFVQCFADRTNTSDLISFPGTSGYQSLLLSSAQNLRFLLSPATSKPALIVAAYAESHAQAAVACAAANNLPLRTRSGGHDYEGMSYVAAGDHFVSLDISGLRSISIAGGGATAWVQAGATIGELYYAIGKHNATAAFPAGICPTVGVGGHFTGGGIGTLIRKFGTSADNIIDARLVDAGGRILDRRSMGEELFWAIRGGGGASFGVVVAFKVNIVAVPPVVTVFSVVKTLRQNATVILDRWQRVVHELDRDIFIRVIAEVITDKDGWRSIQLTFNSIYLGRHERVLALTEQSFPELGLTAGDCREMSWLESNLFFNGDSGKTVETLLDRNPRFNRSFKAKSDFVGEPIPASGWEKIWGFLMDAIDEPVVLILDPFGGKMSEIEEDAIAFPHRKGNLYNVQYFMEWTETEEKVTERHLEWMRRLYEVMGPYVSSKPRAAYYNYKDLDLGKKKTRYREARVWGRRYFKKNFWRLAVVKGKVDPGNFFTNEQSIPPLFGAKQSISPLVKGRDPALYVS